MAMVVAGGQSGYGAKRAAGSDGAPDDVRRCLAVRSTGEKYAVRQSMCLMIATKKERSRDCGASEDNEEGATGWRAKGKAQEQEVTSDGGHKATRCNKELTEDEDEQDGHQA
jgi:hypothetical protein